MKKIILTSERFAGAVTFGFNAEFDSLIFYLNESEMSPEQHGWLLTHLPHTSSDLRALAAKHKWPLVEEPADISFDAFWNEYDHKVNRKRVEPMYKKLKDEEKLLAIVIVKSYKKHCASKNRGVVDPERYIRDRYFETNWRALK